MDEFKSDFSELIKEFLSIRAVSVCNKTLKRDARNLQLFEEYFVEKSEGKSLFDHDSIIDWQLSLQKEHA